LLWSYENESSSANKMQIWPIAARWVFCLDSHLEMWISLVCLWISSAILH
jgi:hypothetical protein